MTRPAKEYHGHPEQYIDNTIHQTVPQLRQRWPKELKEYPDRAVAITFLDFYFSEDAGNNDEKFPEWFQYIKDNM